MKTILMLGAALAATLATAHADWSVRYDDRGGRDCGPRHERGGYYERSGYCDRGGPPVRAYVRVEECERPRPPGIEALAQIQLRRLGYYGGPVDGDFGYGSQRALIRFQYDHRLEANGCLDWRTRRALGV